MSINAIARTDLNVINSFFYWSEVIIFIIGSKGTNTNFNSKFNNKKAPKVS